ncbi:hypothetical protein ACIQV3_40470 [Streptomyces sp. NPDC099050]|uniref:hypothetical protein n=1 Tax=Streptomyces sp. NPDC099050 TaxID=3366100 RepID=UPI00380E6BB1
MSMLEMGGVPTEGEPARERPAEGAEPARPRRRAVARRLVRSAATLCVPVALGAVRVAVAHWAPEWADVANGAAEAARLAWSRARSRRRPRRG